MYDLQIEQNCGRDLVIAATFSKAFEKVQRSKVQSWITLIWFKRKKKKSKIEGRFIAEERSCIK